MVLFAFQRSRRLWTRLGTCGWLTKPIPMALVTLGASLALKGRRTAAGGGQSGRRRCCWVWRWSGCPERVAFALLRLTPENGPSHVHRVFLRLSPLGGMPVLRPRRAARSAYGAACRGRSGLARALPGWTALFSEVPAMAVITAAYLWLFDGPCTTPCCESRSLNLTKKRLRAVFCRSKGASLGNFCLFFPAQIGFLDALAQQLLARTGERHHAGFST